MLLNYNNIYNMKCCIFKKCTNCLKCRKLFKNQINPNEYILNVIKFKHKKSNTVEDKDINCSICIEKNNNNSIILECKHVFHFNCIRNWIKKCKNDNIQITCPLCKNIIKINKYKEI